MFQEAITIHLKNLSDYRSFNMEPSYILLIILGAMLLLVSGGFIVYRLMYNNYLNKRLKGETDKQKFFSFNYKVFAIIMIINICVAAITSLSMSLLNAKTQLAHYRGRLDELYPRQQMLSDDAVIADFKWLTDGIITLDLSGYTINKTTSGDFDCYTARAKETIINNSLMPSLVIYFKYIGGELENPSIEFHYVYSNWQGGNSITYNEQYLYISRLYHDEILLSIDIKISTDPQANKNPQIHSQSHFDFNK